MVFNLLLVELTVICALADNLTWVGLFLVTMDCFTSIHSFSTPENETIVYRQFKPVNMFTVLCCYEIR